MNNMTEKDFNVWSRALTDQAFEIMAKANQEYASEEGKFDNFQGIAEFCRRFNPRLKDITPQDVAWVYALKHIISVMKGISLREDLEGRVIDILNYTLMIGGMWEADRRAEEVEPDPHPQCPATIVDDGVVICCDKAPHEDSRHWNIEHQYGWKDRTWATA